MEARALKSQFWGSIESYHLVFGFKYPSWVYAGFPKLRVPFWGPNLGSMLGSPIFGNYHVTVPTDTWHRVSQRPKGSSMNSFVSREFS